MTVIWYLIGLFTLCIIAAALALAIIIPTARHWRRKMKERGLHGFYDPDGNWIGITTPNPPPPDPPYPPPPNTFSPK